MLFRSGCIVNIVLDPILIFGLFGMPTLGVKGAAIATVIGQMVSCLLGIILFARGKSGFQLQSKKEFVLNGNIIKSIYSVAIPSTLIMAFPSVLVACLNSILIRFSEIAVAVFGVFYKLQTFVYMPATGLVQGIRPIIAYNYGAGNQKREKQAVKISFIVVGVIMMVGTFLFWSYPAQIMRVFGAEEEMLSLGITTLRVISIGFLPSAVGIVTSAVFESKGYGNISLLITLVRQLVIVIPIAIITSFIMGITGVWISLVKLG